MNAKRDLLRLGCVFFVLQTVAGCGREIHFGVMGRITLNGEPLENATVSFLPDDESMTAAVARTDERGMYTAEISQARNGLRPGHYSVRITTADDGDIESDPPLLSVPERVPSKYNYDSTLQVEVKAEMNVFDFELDTKGRIEE